MENWWNKKQEPCIPGENGDETETSSIKRPLSPRDGRKIERGLRQTQVVRSQEGAETLQRLKLKPGRRHLLLEIPQQQKQEEIHQHCSSTLLTWGTRQNWKGSFLWDCVNYAMQSCRVYPRKVWETSVHSRQGPDNTLRKHFHPRLTQQTGECIGITLGVLLRSYWQEYGWSKGNCIPQKSTPARVQLTEAEISRVSAGKSASWITLAIAAALITLERVLLDFATFRIFLSLVRFFYSLGLVYFFYFLSLMAFPPSPRREHSNWKYSG